MGAPNPSCWLSRLDFIPPDPFLRAKGNMLGVRGGGVTSVQPVQHDVNLSASPIEIMTLS